MSGAVKLSIVTETILDRDVENKKYYILCLYYVLE